MTVLLQVDSSQVLGEWVALYGFGLVSLVLIALWFIVGVIASWAAFKMRGVEASVNEMRPGSVWLRGRVSYAEGDEAVRVEVEQEGKEWLDDSGEWKSTWTEEARRTEARPFVLVLPDQQRVRVVPPDDVLLIAPIRPQVKEQTKRTLVASLSEGDIALVAGKLEDGGESVNYRELGGRWTLRSRTKGHSMVVCTEPSLGCFFATKAVVALGVAVGGAMLLAVAHSISWTRGAGPELVIHAALPFALLFGGTKFVPHDWWEGTMRSYRTGRLREPK